MENLSAKFQKMHLLSRAERIKLNKELYTYRPEFLKPYLPKWFWWKRCRVHVLIVCDGGLNFGTTGFGLSEFLTTFNKLEANSVVDYRVTLAHRGTAVPNPNPVVEDVISGFSFLPKDINLHEFDQIWLFGIRSGNGVSDDERIAIEAYMKAGGGLFATGDHGSLGSALCSNIARVKDMRHWRNFPNSNDNFNEVSMGGKRRNDTNRPAAGDATSVWFDNQSDEIPQTIGVRPFTNGMPHPLLSISPRLRASGIIDIMPDHPHEGECKPETAFTVNGKTVPTQIIATSYVLGGSSTYNKRGKDLTEPHCFPSISVWDGRVAGVGRIVVDSTWHHFVNINLNGEDSYIDKPGKQPGLTNADFTVIRQYFMNIATWMTRKRKCWKPYLVYELFADSQLIEASLDNPIQDLEAISLADLNSIGALAEEILSARYNPAFARNFLLDIMRDYHEGFSNKLDIWRPHIKEEHHAEPKAYYHDWLNLDMILWTAIGSGFIALRDDKKFSIEEVDEDDLERLDKVFQKGMRHGFHAAIENLRANFSLFEESM